MDTYSIDSICNNCGTRGKVEVPKGVEVDAQECPNCGVKGLKRDPNARPDRTTSYYNFK